MTVNENDARVLALWQKEECRQILGLEDESKRTKLRADMLYRRLKVLNGLPVENVPCRAGAPGGRVSVGKAALGCGPYLVFLAVRRERPTDPVDERAYARECLQEHDGKRWLIGFTVGSEDEVPVIYRHDGQYVPTFSDAMTMALDAVEKYSPE
jgi:hypothetical protein